LHSLRAELGRIDFGRNLAVDVVGVGGAAEDDLRAVPLHRVHQLIDETGGLSHRDGEHPGGVRIERAGMAHLAGVGGAPYAANDVEGRDALRLVDVDPTAEGSRHGS
jgi:hypothetical protein